ncbi:xanthine dehydrogenase accessory protein XdhC [Salaquimonas pukyongi]|uniref:xanthine dehydrogenase accessory protein XdhC n=1 Tax=Salaquimonas pukyongi TaxID=2712698 RepID=UPI00096B6B0F|nr:xanthine dehydrogenase accessory protein XdhC [Salaquimonas pukyongi]
MTDQHQNRLAEQALALLERDEPAILVSVTGTRGSTPRNTGTWMMVTRGAVLGTIGGGQLEWLVTGKARDLLEAEKAGPVEHQVPLGPQINQCCGGRVTLRFEPLDSNALARVARQDSNRRNPVQIHGAGHTGTALVRALSLLPLDVQLVDVRAEALEDLQGNVDTRCLAMPEQAVREASPGTAFVVLTHSHDLDFLISAEALCRGDAAYVGMIGSKTKRSVFSGWLGDNGYDAGLASQLVCPIGAQASGVKVNDKRPEVIAALVAAELVTLFAAQA